MLQDSGERTIALRNHDMGAVPRPIACVFTATLLLVLSQPMARGQGGPKKKPLAVEDLYRLESVRSPMLFPKEDKLVYERIWIDAQTKRERHALWLVTGKRENRKPLEEGEPDGRSPVISPDGQWIAFLSTRPRSAKTLNALARPPVPPYSDAAVDLWLYHVKAEKVLPILTIGRAPGRVFHDGFYGRVAFSPDSTKVVFVADDAVSPRTREEIDNEVEIVRPDQGEGYTGYGPAQIWIADIAGQPAQAAGDKITRLTKDDVWYGDPQWSPDGKSIVVHANKTKDRESVRFSINKNFDLYLIDVATKKQTRLTTNPGPDVSPRFSPDGKQIAYLSSPRKGPHRDVFNLGIVTLGDSVPKVRILYDHHELRAPSENNESPVFPLPTNCWKSDREVCVQVEVGTTTTRDVIDVRTGRSARETPLTSDKRLQALMPPANGIQQQRFAASAEVVQWRNDKLDIEGIFTAPPAEVAKPPYKLIVYPHGGPHGRSALGFDFTVQLLAAHGYAVFQPNFRGSTGEGKKFLDADRLDLGGGDMRDILTGIDKLVKDGKVDPQRQFVYGTSYGGFMTSWLVGHTHQFRAAVAQNAVTDMNMMWGLTDIQSWTQWELGGTPWEQPERYRKHSPLTYADKVKTPTLILHARDDRRCPLPMGKAFYQALLANSVPTQMVIYPDEGHGIRQPRHREDVLRRVLAWFAKYEK
jgi:dipeptidyl aminopeptidase/acylaminoacyl peptidase